MNKVTVSTTLTVQYSTKDWLGKGSMETEVFEGKLDKRKKAVAVKEYSHNLVKWLDNDVDSLNTAEGHNVVRYFCTLTNNENKAKSDFHYLAMELCDATLKDWAEKTKKGEIVQKIKDLDILSQCVSGLMFIHEIKLAHRNLRPTNILLLKERENNVVVKISDFGLTIKNEQEDKSYHPKSLHGPLGWRSQEFLKITESVGSKKEKAQLSPEDEQKLLLETEIKSDIFSLGCIFYYVVTKGKHPFGEVPLHIQANIKSGNMSDLSCNKAYESRGLLNLIKLMIAGEPEKRPPLEIVKSHPVFWDAPKVMRISNEVNAQRENTNVVFVKTFEEFELLGKNKELVIKQNEEWTKIVNSKLGTNFKSKDFKTVTDLNRAFRNFYEHRKEGNKPKIIRDSSEEEYVNLWLGMFPQLLTCIWIVFKKLLDNGETQFAYFYEDPANPFWRENHRFKLINNDLEVKETPTGLTVTLVKKGSGGSMPAGPSASSN